MAESFKSKLINKLVDVVDHFSRTASIPAVGDRGVLAGFQRAEILNGASVDIDINSNDTIVWEGSGDVTVTFKPADKSYVTTKAIMLKATGDVNVTWKGCQWCNDEQPKFSKQSNDLTLVATWMGGVVMVGVYHNTQKE